MRGIKFAAVAKYRCEHFGIPTTTWRKLYHRHIGTQAKKRQRFFGPPVLIPGTVPLAAMFATHGLVECSAGLVIQGMVIGIGNNGSGYCEQEQDTD